MIEDIQRFIIVSDTNSITQAAKQLHLTQPALSLAMQRLEKSLNKKLFSHTNRQLRISPQGKAFYPVANKIIELWEKAKTNQVNIPTIALGLFDNAALRLASYVHTQMRQKSPHVTVHIDRSRNLLRDLSLGLLDIAVFVQGLEKEITPYTKIVTTFEEELLPVGTKEIAEKKHKPPFILYNTGSHTRNHIDHTFIRNNMQPTILAESTSTSFMKALALNGSGIALLPKAVIATELQQKQLTMYPLKYRFFRTVTIAIKEDTQNITQTVASEIAKQLTT